MGEYRLGLVGAGARGLGHLRSTYRVRDQSYLHCESPIGHPHRIDHDYAESAREWAMETSDLEPNVTAVCDPNEAARTEAVNLCGEHGDAPTAFESFGRFLECDAYDAAIVATPNDYHARQTKGLLDRDISVFSEKPIGITIAEHDDLIAADQAAGGTLFVGFNLRSSPFYTRLKELIDAGAFGDLGMIGCREARGHFHAEYSFATDRSGGTLLDKNCHDFDLFNWYADADPVRVAAFGGQHFHSTNTDVNDQSVVIIEYDTGLLASLELCMYAPFGERTRMYALRGTEGLLRARKETGEADLFRRGSRDTIRVSGPQGGHGGADVVQMVRFLRFLAGDADRPADPVDAKKADAIALAAERAITDRTMVELDSNYNLITP